MQRKNKRNNKRGTEQMLQTRNRSTRMVESRNPQAIQRERKKGEYENERGNTLASNLGKLYKRIVNIRVAPNINISEHQGGGQKGKSTLQSDKQKNVRNTYQ